MAAHQQRLAGFRLVPHHLEQVLACWWIDGAAGFVQQQDLGLLHQRSGQQDALLLAAGELVEAPVPHGSHADAFQQLFAVVRCCGFALFGLPQLDHVAGGDRKRPINGGPLGHQADGLAGVDRSLAGFQSSFDQMQQR